MLKIWVFYINDQSIGSTETKYIKLNTKTQFVLTAISHRGLRNDFFFLQPLYFFQFLFGLLFPFSIWTLISLFYLDFYFETFQDISRHFETFRDIYFENNISRHTFRDISRYFDLFLIFPIAVWFWISFFYPIENIFANFPV